MDTRREFLKKAAMLGAGAGLTSALPASIAKALSINPAVGTTFLDAEHVVILMQENRSFDHCYGTLQGVRGFNDPRALRLANQLPVWYQTNEAHETFGPFRLNIKDTNATWMGSLPHSWTDQVDALNKGRMDQWLIAKKSGNKAYRHMPLTMGHYTREDIPFYYSLADAFTVCDQHFCSSLTGTTPNRLYLWSGTIREKPSSDAYANVRNENVDYDKLAHWTTFPERLEAAGVSWKIYQNELSVGVGLEGEEDAWLSNFTDNPIEWFEQYHVKFHKAYRDSLPAQIARLTEERKALESKQNSSGANDSDKKKLQSVIEELQTLESDLKNFTEENYKKLSALHRSIHEKAFTTNRNDPKYHKLASIQYDDAGTSREVQVPAGDTLHQFRDDVKNNRLPAVSWLVAPENFSDHPGAPWYGAWYVSEVMDILTKNPEVWRKTIFILTYDENDGYFDHVPPFTPVNPLRTHGGKMSSNIERDTEFVTRQQDMKKKDEAHSRESSIGLGYRVPMVIASPWSRGGNVCSQVFDHTSVVQFLEIFTSHKSKKAIRETNITNWRRTVCGNLVSAFQPYQGEEVKLPIRLDRDEFVEGIHSAQFKNVPGGYRALGEEELKRLAANETSSLSLQEKGTRTSCPLPYELYATGALSRDRKTFEISLLAGKNQFGANSAGAPFHVYAPAPYQDEGSAQTGNVNWQYAVSPGDKLIDQWPLANFEGQRYELQVYGPNGFFRQFAGDATDPKINVACMNELKNKKPTGNVVLQITNSEASKVSVVIRDHSYGQQEQKQDIGPGKTGEVVLSLASSHHWYDCTVTVDGHEKFSQRFSGKVEDGMPGKTDPAMAG
ncbi:phospholipase C, phosphocholine-specific [Chryseolinea sp. T2]|uniref:phosphocholine-specific phospholipase C n=1 Tax=Chryseolinea sp. T2 TaxID=3129255 RepID=UPI00307848B9